MQEIDPITRWKNGKNDTLRFQNILNKTQELDRDALDLLAQKKTKEAYNKIDCLKCANCCKTTVTTFTTTDISRISKHLGISKKAFKRKYVFEDLDGTFTSMGVPCPFLQPDNKCQVYEVAPEACSSYPHTQRKVFMSRKRAHLANVDICPITFKVLEEIETRLINSHT